LAIALIAAVITIFVIAASLLGRAIEESSREQEEVARKESSEFDETIAGLQQQLKEAKGTKVIDDLKRQIAEYEEKKKEAEKDLKRISQKYGMLTVRGTVLYPGMFFLISIVLAGIARYTATIPLATVSYILWGLSLAAIIWGSYRICKCLKVIEGVAITTEEAQYKRMTQALETALERHEESKRPKLGLEFKKRKPPFSFKPDAKETIEFSVSIEHGFVAKSAEVWFFAPKGFGFPGQDTWNQDSDFVIPNALTTNMKVGDLISGTRYPKNIDIKMPSKKGEYTLRYRLKCEDFSSERIEFKVKVE
jgi:hypothetical protein